MPFQAVYAGRHLPLSDCALFRRGKTGVFRKMDFGAIATGKATAQSMSPWQFAAQATSADASLCTGPANCTVEAKPSGCIMKIQELADRKVQRVLVQDNSYLRFYCGRVRSPSPSSLYPFLYSGQGWHCDFYRFT